jgi:hypothetical protein
MASTPLQKLNINNVPTVCKEEYYYTKYFNNRVMGQRQCSVGSEQEPLADRCEHHNKSSDLTKCINLF